MVLSAVPLLLAKSSSGAKGDTLVGGAEGPGLPSRLPHARGLIFPSSQESVVFLLPIYYDCISAAPTAPPMGGRGTWPCLLHFFYLGTVPDKITSVQFFTTGIAHCLPPDTADLHTRSAQQSASLLYSTKPAFQPGVQSHCPPARPLCHPSSGRANCFYTISYR